MAERTQAPAKKVNWWDAPAPNELMDDDRLPLPIAKKLVASGYTTAQQIRDAGEEKILDVEGLGKRGVEAIKEWLRAVT